VVREAGSTWGAAGAESLAALLDRLAAGAGQELVLDRDGRPVAKLVPIAAAPRRPGRLKDRLTIRDDFDEPLPPDLAAAFRGETG
jgi:antitoxin (DNA-binding transcriptional repressor) of toxin-antitoxin stability system